MCDLVVGRWKFLVMKWWFFMLNLCILVVLLLFGVSWMSVWCLFELWNIVLLKVKLVFFLCDRVFMLISVC